MKFLSLALLLLSACAWAQNSDYQPDPNWQAPSAAAEKKNPLANNPDLAAGGRKVFMKTCVSCHGESGEGVKTKKAADLKLPVVQQQSDGTLFWKITNGNQRRGMPSFSGIPEMQRWQLVLYLRTLSEPQQSVK